MRVRDFSGEVELIGRGRFPSSGGLSTTPSSIGKIEKSIVNCAVVAEYMIWPKSSAILRIGCSP